MKGHFSFSNHSKVILSNRQEIGEALFKESQEVSTMSLVLFSDRVEPSPKVPSANSQLRNLWFRTGKNIDVARRSTL